MRALVWLSALVAILTITLVDAKIVIVDTNNWHSYAGQTTVASNPRNIGSHQTSSGLVVGQPGIKVRLTRKGAEHLKTIGVQLLNEQLSTLSGVRANHAFESAGISGQIHLTDVRTLTYQPPTASHIAFNAPSFITMSLENLAIR